MRDARAVFSSAQPTSQCGRVGVGTRGDGFEVEANVVLVLSPLCENVKGLIVVTK